MAANAQEPLDFSNVSPQTPFPTPTSQVSGTGYIDFTISEGAEVRIAIEVDGWDKTGRQEGETSEEFRNKSRREADITAQGWRVLRFANSHFDREPEQVAKCVWLNLKRDRELKRQLRETHAQTAELEDQISRRPTADDLSSIEKLLWDAKRRAEELENALHNLSHPLPGVVEEQFPNGEIDELRKLNTASASQNKELEARILQEIDAREKAERESRLVRVVLVSITVIIIGVVTATYLITKPPPDPCAPPIAWSDAAGCVGESTTVQGEVAGVANGTGNDPGPSFINVGRPFPDGFAVVIFDEDILESLKVRGGVPHVGDTVCVEGTITEFSGRPQTKVEVPSQLSGCGS